MFEIIINCYVNCIDLIEWKRKSSGRVDASKVWTFTVVGDWSSVNCVSQIEADACGLL